MTFPLSNSKNYIICQYCGSPQLRQKVPNSPKSSILKICSYCGQEISNFKAIGEKKENIDIKESFYFQMRYLTYREIYQMLRRSKLKESDIESLDLTEHEISKYTEEIKQETIDGFFLNDLLQEFPRGTYPQIRRLFQEVREELLQEQLFQDDYRILFEEAIMEVYSIICGDQSWQDLTLIQKKIIANLIKRCGFNIEEFGEVNAFNQQILLLSSLHFHKILTKREEVFYSNPSSNLSSIRINELSQEFTDFFTGDQVIKQWSWEGKSSQKREFEKELLKLQKNLRSDWIFRESFVAQARRLVIFISQLILGKIDIENLKGIEKNIVKKLIKELNFDKFSDFSPLFKFNFMLVISRLVYYIMRIYPKGPPLGKNLMDSQFTTTQRIIWYVKKEILASESIRMPFLNNLHEMTSQEFNNSYSALKRILKNDFLFSMSFSRYLDKIIQQVIRIVSTTRKKSHHSLDELAIIENLVNYNFNWNVNDEKAYPLFNYAIKEKELDLNLDAFNDEFARILTSFYNTNIKKRNFFHYRTNFHFAYNSARINKLPVEISTSINNFFTQLLNNEDFGIFNQKNIMFTCSRLTVKYLTRNAPKKIRKILLDRDLITEFTINTPEIDSNLKFLISSAKKIEQYQQVCGDILVDKHQFIEKLLLIENKNVLGVEIPIWDRSFNITGHIDLLLKLALDGIPHLVVADYKPDIKAGTEQNFLKYFPQVAMYAYLLKKRLGFPKDLKILCALFNEEKLWIFEPEIVKNELPTLVKDFYDPIYFTPFKNVFGEINNYLLSNWEIIFQFDSLYGEISDFPTFFKKEVSKILGFSEYLTFKEIWSIIHQKLQSNLESINDNRQKEHINNLDLINSKLNDLDNEIDLKGHILNFSRAFRLKLLLFKSIKDNEMFKTKFYHIFEISKFCYTLSHYHPSVQIELERKLISRTRKVLKRFAKDNCMFKDLQAELGLSHNTINSVISRLWHKYRINNYGELMQFYIYRDLDHAKLMSYLQQGLTYNEIEKNFLIILAKRDYSSIQMAEILKIDERTVRRKIKNHFKGKTLETLKQSILPEKEERIHKEREKKRKQVKNKLESFENIEKIKKDLGIGDHQLRSIANESFKLDLTPEEIKIYLGLENLDKTLLSQLYQLNLFSIKEIRLIFMEKIIRQGALKGELGKLINLSTKQIDRLIKKWDKEDTYDTLSKKIKGKYVDYQNYLIYKILISKSNSKSNFDNDKKILSNFKQHFPEYYSSLLATKISSDEMKRRFILKMASENMNTSETANFYGYADRSSLRYEIYKLWNRDTTFTTLKNLVLKKKNEDKIYLVQIERLALNSSIREISRILKISTWKIEKIIEEHHQTKSFSRLKTYLACKSINQNLLLNLEKKGLSFEEIVSIFIESLLNRKKKKIDISSLLKIPQTELKHMIHRIKDKS